MHQVEQFRFDLAQSTRSGEQDRKDADGERHDRIWKHAVLEPDDDERPEGYLGDHVEGHEQRHEEGLQRFLRRGVFRLRHLGIGGDELFREGAVGLLAGGRLLEDHQHIDIRVLVCLATRPGAEQANVRDAAAEALAHPAGECPGEVPAQVEIGRGEVEVDPETGQVKLRQLTSAFAAAAALRLARFNVLSRRQEAAGQTGPGKYTLGLPIPAAAVMVAASVAFVIITFLHIVIGEQAPKVWAIRNAERVIILSTPPMSIFDRVFRPFIVVLDYATEASRAFVTRRIDSRSPTIAI